MMRRSVLVWEALIGPFNVFFFGVDLTKGFKIDKKIS